LQTRYTRRMLAPRLCRWCMEAACTRCLCATVAGAPMYAFLRSAVVEHALDASAYTLEMRASRHVSVWQTLGTTTRESQSRPKKANMSQRRRVPRLYGGAPVSIAHNGADGGDHARGHYGRASVLFRQVRFRASNVRGGRRDDARGSPRMSRVNRWLPRKRAREYIHRSESREWSDALPFQRSDK
jgi:hypothetical protein